MKSVITCKICKLEKNKFCKDICSHCYYKKRRQDPEKREKLLIRKRIDHRKKNGLPLDEGKKIRPERREFCLLCNEKTKIGFSSLYCSSCYWKKCRDENPDRREYDRKRGRDKVRLKKGLPLDYDFGIRKAGMGSIRKEGYKVISKKNHPNARKDGIIFEHVFIMSEYLGRSLIKGESVHHKNGIRDDNRIENLELWNKGQPAGQRVEDKIKFYIEFLDQYGYDVKKRGE